MYLVALTGGIGSGKSTVANMFHKLGIDIVDCDAISRELTAPNSPISNEIIKHFGEGILLDPAVKPRDDVEKGILDSRLPASLHCTATSLGNNVLSREKLSQIIFNNKHEKTWLENLLHPEIIKIMHERIKESKSNYVIAAIPLLFETKQEKNFNRILTITCSEETQIKRLKLRDKKSQTELKNIIKQQINDEYRKKYSDDIINNDGDIDYLKQQILMLHKKYLKLAGGK